MKKIISLAIVSFCSLLVGLEPPLGMPVSLDVLNQQLAQAVISEDLAQTHALLAQDANPNLGIHYPTPVSPVKTLLEIAIQFSNRQIVKALLDAGADPSVTPQLLCDVLISDVKTTENMGGLLIASYPIRDMLIEHPKTNLNCLAWFKQTELTPLMYAVRNEDNSLVDKLLKTGRVDINMRNSRGKTALDFAKMNHMRTKLLAHATPVFPTFIPTAAQHPLTPRSVAPATPAPIPAATQPTVSHKRKETGPSKQEIPAAASHVDPVEIVIDAIYRNDPVTALNYLNRGGFDINKKDHTGRRILTFAIQKNALPIVQQLVLTPELQINYRTIYGTPLTIASRHSSPDIVKALLMRKDVLVNEIFSGKTALDFAEKNFPNSKEILQLLRMHGAKTAQELRRGPVAIPAAAQPTVPAALLPQIPNEQGLREEDEPASL